MAVDVKTFATLLAKSLVKRGISREVAVKHAVSLVRTFDEEDLREISTYTSPEQFEDLSDSLADLIKDKDEEKARAVKHESHESVGATEVPPDATREIPIYKEVNEGSGIDHIKAKAQSIENGDISFAHTMQYTGLNTSDISIKTDTHSDITMVNIPAVSVYSEEEQDIYVSEEDDIEEEEKAVVLTKRGKAFFWGTAVATSPVMIIVAALILGVFAIGILTVCASIAAFLLLVCAEAVAGSGLTLIGIIYGAIEIFSGNTAIGIYEIGLGICCGAVALCLGILTYNFAVIVLPYALKQLIAFEGYFLKRVGLMVRRFREECNRL